MSMSMFKSKSFQWRTTLNWDFIVISDILTKLRVSRHCPTNWRSSLIFSILFHLRLEQNWKITCTLSLYKIDRENIRKKDNQLYFHNQSKNLFQLIIIIDY